MPEKPEYRFRFEIYDETNDEVVARGDTYLSSVSAYGECESVDMEVSSVLRGFDRLGRERYEAKNYPQEETAV